MKSDGASQLVLAVVFVEHAPALTRMDSPVSATLLAETNLRARAPALDFLGVETLLGVCPRSTHFPAPDAVLAGAEHEGRHDLRIARNRFVNHRFGQEGAEFDFVDADHLDEMSAALDTFGLGGESEESAERKRGNFGVVNSVVVRIILAPIGHAPLLRVAHFRYGIITEYFEQVKGVHLLPTRVC